MRRIFSSRTAGGRTHSWPTAGGFSASLLRCCAITPRSLLPRFLTRFTENTSRLSQKLPILWLDCLRVMQNQGGSVVLGAGAIGVDLIDAAAGERRKLFNDCAVNQDAEAAAGHCAVL